MRQVDTPPDSDDENQRDAVDADDLAPFVHPAEADFAAFLDFYRIRWQYEPRSFALRWRDGRVAQMFTPDFYLPEQDLYVELTTVKQALVTRKNRKIRRLRELYPTVNVVLLNRKGFHELLSRFGYGAVDITSLSEEDIERVLLSQAEIQQRVKTLGEQISADYAGESLVLIDSADATATTTDAPPATRTASVIDFRDPVHVSQRVGRVHGQSRPRNATDPAGAFQWAAFDGSARAARVLSPWWREPLP